MACLLKMNTYFWNLMTLITKAYRWFFYYYFFSQKPGLLLLKAY